MFKALLFLNGEPPTTLPRNLSDYAIIACTDGAYAYLQHQQINIDYIIGDLDSINILPSTTVTQVIRTPDQNFTDFEKALRFLMQKQVTDIDIYGVSGRASDHFLGNLSVGLAYSKQLNLYFYDNHSYFFYAKPCTQLKQVKGKIISIMPFPTAYGVTLTGFVYPLANATLYLGGLTSIRNQANRDTVEVKFEQGELIIFVNHA
jgi:thiamine pyrophosphokinase